MKVTKKFTAMIQGIQNERKDLAKNNVRIEVSGDKVTDENLNVGFDPKPLRESDELISEDGVNIVFDAQTAVLLAEATLDCDSSDHVTVRFPSVE